MRSKPLIHLLATGCQSHQTQAIVRALRLVMARMRLSVTAAAATSETNKFHARILLANSICQKLEQVVLLVKSAVTAAELNRNR